MRLHVVTAITRPANLARIAESLSHACDAAQCSIVWHWKHDWYRDHVGGQKPKNDALDAITDGWVWFLDDDTIANPGVLRAFLDAATSEVDAVVFSQSRLERPALRASPDHARRGHIDIGQAFLRRSVIGDARIPEDYDGDGMFLEPLLARIRVAYVDEVLTHHNALVLVS